MILKTPDWLFMSTRKCATNTMYDALKKIGGRRIGGFHSTVSQRKADVQFTICRNPYDRAVSIWASTCMRGSDRYHARMHIGSKGGNPDDFGDFVRYCLPGDRAWRWARDPWLFRNQTDWLDRMQPLDRICFFESLQEDVSAIVGPIDLPVLNSSDHPIWESLMTPEIAERIEAWAPKDFALGYEKWAL